MSDEEEYNYSDQGSDDGSQGGGDDEDPVLIEIENNFYEGEGENCAMSKRGVRARRYLAYNACRHAAEGTGQGPRKL